MFWICLMFYILIAIVVCFAACKEKNEKKQEKLLLSAPFWGIFFLVHFIGYLIESAIFCYKFIIETYGEIKEKITKKPEKTKAE